MAYREVFVLEVKEILRLWARGRGYRDVARVTGVDRKTVRRYVEAARALGLCRGEDERALGDGLVAAVSAAVIPGRRVEDGAMRAHCRTQSELIEGWVKEGCNGPKLVRLLARQTGVVVPLRTLQRFVAEELGRDCRSRETVRVVDPPPGQVVEVDFLKLGSFVERGSGRRLDMYALLCTAAYSRHQFLWPCLKEKQEDLIEGLEAAWRFFGGVFPVLVPDNLKAVVEGSDPLLPRLNPEFLEYAQARGFEVDPARKRKAQDKARVERQVRYSRDDYFRGEGFGSLEEARRAAERWCREEAGRRVHGTTRRQPLEVFEQEELPLLRPVPSEPYDLPAWTTIKVGRDHVVAVARSLYSVPHELGQVQLRVRRDRATVKMYVGARLVKVHGRVREGESSIDPADLPAGKAELATRDRESYRKQAAAAGDHVGQYVDQLLQGPFVWTRMRHVYRLLGLVRRYGRDQVEEACQRALDFGVVDVTRIDRMLQRGLARRGLLPEPPPVAPSNVIRLRFARDPTEYRAVSRHRGKGGCDASA